MKKTNSKKYAEGWDRIFNETPKKERRKRQVKILAKGIGAGAYVAGCGIVLKPYVVPMCIVTGAAMVLEAVVRAKEEL